jgi:predicted benzoate:H+ symporter BenE
MNWSVFMAALAAVITFVVTASGISLFGIGAAFGDWSPVVSPVLCSAEKQ